MQKTRKIFHTGYDPAPLLNASKVYDSHDNVDRVSYVDSTRLVERFIAEGQNLNMARARALRSGLYSGDMNEIEHDNGIILPVFVPDRAEIDPVLDMAKKRQTSEIAARNVTNSNDAKRSGNPEVTASTPASGVNEA